MSQTLGQIVGIHKGTKTDAQRGFDNIYKTFQKGDLFVGLSKRHAPFEGTLPQPPQEKKIQANATELLGKMEEILIRSFDVEATKDYTDTEARASIKLSDGTILLENVPVTHLLWLEKQFANFVTVFRALPVQSAAERWLEADNLALGEYRTADDIVPSTKRVTDFRVIVQPTDHHPAEIREVSKDEQSGNWTTVKYTSAITTQQKEELVKRATDMLNATKQAIVVANHQEVTSIHEGQKIFSRLFDGVLTGR